MKSIVIEVIKNLRKPDKVELRVAKLVIAE